MTGERTRSAEAMNVMVQADNSGLVVKAVRGEEVLGYLVVDSLVNGTCCGGLRMVQDIDEAQLRAAARSMTLKYGYVGVAQGGAKAGVRGDPEAPEPVRTARLLEFARAIAPLLRGGLYAPYQDIGTDNDLIRLMLRQVGVRVRRRQLFKTPSGHYTALSVRACAAEAARHRGLDLAGCTVAIEGFGKVGAPLATLMTDAGARVVAVSTSRGAIHAPGGLDTHRLAAMAEETGSRVVEAYGQADRIEKEALLELPVDLLCPCARHHSLHAGNAARVAARIVCPGANNPYAPGVDAVLLQRGVLVLPDFMANCGGVLGGTMQFASLGQDRIAEYIDRHIGGHVAAILAEADRQGVTPARIAEGIALRRFERFRRAAEHPTLSGRMLGAALAMYRSGLLPSLAVTVLAPGYFRRVLALSERDWPNDG